MGEDELGKLLLFYGKVACLCSVYWGLLDCAYEIFMYAIFLPHIYTSIYVEKLQRGVVLASNA